MAEEHVGFEGTGDIDLLTNSKKLTCPDPTADQEAATKKYHDDNTIASLIPTDTTNFDTILSSADDTVQKALDTLDDGGVPIVAKVNEAGGITEGKAVYITGATGDKAQVSLADNTAHDSAHSLGIAMETKSDNQNIRIMRLGFITDIDTSGFNEGDRLHLSTSGNMTAAVQNSGAHIHMGWVTKSDASEGIILVKTDDYVHDIRGVDDQQVEIACGDDDNTGFIYFQDYSRNNLGFIRGDGLFQWDGALNLGDGGDAIVFNPTTAVSFSDKNISNVADISLDTISSDGSTILIGLGSTSNIAITDNTTLVNNIGTDSGDDWSVNNGSDVLLIEGDTKLSTFTGNVLVSKADPEIKLTDENGDSSCWTRVSGSAQMNICNIVLKPGNTGYALNFDGDPEYVNMGTSFNPTTNDFSISAWFKVDGNTRSVIAGNREFSNPFTGFILFIDTDDKFNVGLNSVTAINYNVGTIDVDDNAWHHVLLVVDRGNDLMHIYTDGGVDAINVDISGTVGSILSTHDMELARDRNGEEDFVGRQDEFAFWSRVLTADDASDLYKGGAGLFIDKNDNFPTSGTSQGLNLEILLHMDEGSGSTANDSSSNGRNATLVNMEEADWVLGDVLNPSPGIDVDMSAIELKDGEGANEAGIITIGKSGADNPRVVLEGQTLRFNIEGVEKAQIDNNGTLTIDNGVTTAQQLILRAAASVSENIFEVQDSSSNIGFVIEADFDVIIGSGAAGKDYTLTFNGENNDGVITYMEDEDYFKSGSKWLFLDRISFTQLDQNEFIDSLTNGELDIRSTISTNFAVATVEQVQVLDGILQPATTNDIDLGTSSLLYKDLWLQNKAQFRDSAIGIYSQADTFMDLFADGGVRIGDSSAGAPTNYTKLSSDGSISQIGTARIDWTKITANNITQGNGTHSGTTGDTSGLVGDIQTAFDGNFYHIDEVGADPGFELTIEFTGVTAFNWVNILASYDGAVTHPVQIGLYNFNTTTWDGFHAMAVIQAEVSTAGEYTLGNHDFFVPSDTNYIGTGGDAGDVRVRFRHTAMGNAAHDLDIDVVALYQ